MSAECPEKFLQRPFTFSRISTAVCCVCALMLLFFFEPSRYHFYPRCLFYQTTGLLCPGCGSLRAAHQLLHGHLAAAFHFNALFVLSVPIVLWLLARWVKGVRNVAPSLNFSVWLGVGLLVGVVFGIVRNLPIGKTWGLAP